MKKILGIDLGVGSIGWAAISIDDSENPIEILGTGSRVVPLTIDETTGFTKGSGESVCAARTLARSMRRNLDRRQQRRRLLGSILESCGMQFGDDLLKLNPMQTWQLRADAASGKELTLAELGRVLYHINARRGYRHSKADENGDKKLSDYLSDISNRVKEATAEGLTPGQYFAKRLKESEYVSESGKPAWAYRIKEKVFLRKSYEEELHRILTAQAQYHPDVLTPQCIERIEDAIFFQRPLKSCKHLVSLCEFESVPFTTKEGKSIVIGPRVASVSSPLAQECRILEAVNNIVLLNYKNKSRPATGNLFEQDEAPRPARLMRYEYKLDAEERRRVADYLDIHEKMNGKTLLSLLGLKYDDGFVVPANISKGLSGNKTKTAIAKALGIPTKRLEEIQQLKRAAEQGVGPGPELSAMERLLEFDLSTDERIDKQTGEIGVKISGDYTGQPFYMLWHTLYSISDKDELEAVLRSKFGITDEEVLDNLFKLDFRAQGYSNKSSKFMCKLLPLLMDGNMYSEACAALGVNHSDSVSKAENDARELLESLPLLKKGELRQPVVEKILNQMIGMVNAAMERFGRFDEIRIEMARELKKSSDQRKADFSRNKAREADKARISAIISGEFGMRPTVNKIQKYRMWEESENCCMYCGQPINSREFLQGFDAEKEHVIPRSLFFDDSFSNKVCACRSCNAAKGQQTAYDFMKSRGEGAFQAYVDRITNLWNKYKTSKGREGISKTKFDRLMTSRKDIPDDFISRDLRLTQYITRKAMEILREVCRNVYATTGSVTDFFRHAWGYDNILHDLNFDAYSAAGQTEIIEIDHKGQIHREERIAGWTKRLDHRHHAIDALTIALTRQGYIQRLNTLNATREKEETEESADLFKEKMGNLEKWAARQPHFSTKDVMDSTAAIAVSFKAGVKATTPGKRYVSRHGKRVCVQRNPAIPRGPLSEGSVYGLRSTFIARCPLKELFARPDDICAPWLRDEVNRRLAEAAFDVKTALKSCKKQPILSPKGKEITEGAMWDRYLALRYPVEGIKLKNVDKIIDSAVRKAVEQRYAEVGEAKYAASIAERPLCMPGNPNIPIKRVMCRTGVTLENSIAVRKDADGRGIGFAKFGSNHHVAIYRNADGSLQETVVPFMQAVERKRLGIKPKS